MREKRKWSKGLLLVLSLCFFVGIMCLGPSGMQASAKEDPFKVQAVLLASDGDTYDVMVTVENAGADWEGTVRLKVDESYRMPAAYDTVIALPQGSTKQFVVKVPKNSIEDTNGTVEVRLLDKKDKVIAFKEFKHLLFQEQDMLGMGILSDNYASLTYLDMGGEELYFYGDFYPIRLTEVTQDNLVDTLDTLEFLVIDDYNTGILTEEELDAIELWNIDGGVLLVGTGSRGSDTLKGFENGYLGIECAQVNVPGTGYQPHSEVDFSKLTMAELRDRNGNFYEEFSTKIMMHSYGDGAIGVLPYALTELAQMDESFYISGINQEMYVLNILEYVSGEAQSRYNNNGYYSDYEIANNVRRMLRVLGNSNSPLNFNVLKVLVIVYVILVGPVLYIILRMTKKKELYWVAVPVAALLGIILIYFAGRGFEVVDTRVFAVSAENLAGTGSRSSYLYCYDAGLEEWDLKLSKGYEYAGALYNNQYGYDAEASSYYHHIRKEGDTLFFGIDPTANFEDSYFLAGSAGGNSTDRGTIVANNVDRDFLGIAGSVTNETNQDFLYFAVVVENYLYVYENLPAGATCDLAQAKTVYENTGSYDMRSDYLYDILNDKYRDKKYQEATELAALGVGLCIAYPQTDNDALVVIGVAENAEKIVDDECKEISYGCFYVVQ